MTDTTRLRQLLMSPTEPPDAPSEDAGAGHCTAGGATDVEGCDVEGCDEADGRGGNFN